MDKTTILYGRSYLKYMMRTDLLCLGERTRGSVFRPCIDVFTYTSLVGALKARFPCPYRRIHAVARFIEEPRRQIFIFSPRDRSRDASTVPLEIECLTNVRAEVYVVLNDFTSAWPDRFTFHLGAMRSKGFGKCHVVKQGIVDPGEPIEGELAVRLPEDPDILSALGVRCVIAPVYGYLFHPERGGGGYYARALFEGSLVEGDPVLVRRE